jgi:hypothetical protein
MGLLDTVRGWFARDREEELEEQEEILRDPELGRPIEDHHGGGGVMPGYTAGGVDRAFEE